MASESTQSGTSRRTFGQTSTMRRAFTVSARFSKVIQSTPAHTKRSWTECLTTQCTTPATPLKRYKKPILILFLKKLLSPPQGIQLYIRQHKRTKRHDQQRQVHLRRLNPAGQLHREPRQSAIRLVSTSIHLFHLFCFRATY